MAALEEVVAALDELVGSGELVGYVAGLRQGGATQVVAGGQQVADGSAMSAEVIFPLSSSTKPVAGVLAMRLVELGLLGLDDPVASHLPELAHLRVLTDPSAPLDSTVPTQRPITLRHLLTMTAGFGWVPDQTPLAEAMTSQRLAPGPFPPPMAPDEFMRRLGELPLAAQPGDGWFYHTSSDVLAVLLARATGHGLADLLREHVLDPLGLVDIGFTAEASRLATPHTADDEGRAHVSRLPDGFLVHPPQFESLACGLASTVGDYLRFLDAVALGPPVLSRGSVIHLATDHLTPAQRRAATGMIDPGSGYGFHVEIRPDGSVGWAGGLGTIAYTNPLTGRSAALFTPQSMEVAGTQTAFEEFWGLLH